jgi:hypothetical protein
MINESRAYAVPIAAQQEMRGLSTNGSAIHKFERAEHIPVLRQQMLHQCILF